MTDVDFCLLYPPPPELPCPSCGKPVPLADLTARVRSCGCVEPEPLVSPYCVASHCDACGDEPRLIAAELSPLSTSDPCRHCGPPVRYQPHDPSRWAFRAESPSGVGWVCSEVSSAVASTWWHTYEAGALRDHLCRRWSRARFDEALAAAREHGGTSLAGWELVVTPRGGGPETATAIRILSDVPDLLPEAIARWCPPGTLQTGPSPDPQECRIMTLEVPGAGEDGGPGLRIVYETRGSHPALGRRLVKVIDPLGRPTFRGLRPPSEDYWRGLPVVAPGRPQDAPEGWDGSR